jgi:hypothetical protein
VGGSDLITEFETTEVAAMEPMEEESVGGDVAVSMDPLVDGVAGCGSRLSSNLWISPPTTSSSSAACVSTPFPDPFAGLGIAVSSSPPPSSGARGMCPGLGGGGREQT